LFVEQEDMGSNPIAIDKVRIVLYRKI
jgi:hypothetical protein